MARRPRARAPGLRGGARPRPRRGARPQQPGRDRGARGPHAEAVERWKRAVALDPRDYQTLFNLGSELCASRAARRRRGPTSRPTCARRRPALEARDIARVRQLAADEPAPMARRARLLAGLAAAAAARCSRASAARRGTGPFKDAPVVLVSIDTLRVGPRGLLRLRARPRRRCSTRSPARASLFESAFSHCPLTLPAHASLFTGLLPPPHGVRDNVGFTLDAKHRTLAHRFQDAGYATARRRVGLRAAARHRHRRRLRHLGRRLRDAVGRRGDRRSAARRRRRDRSRRALRRVPARGPLLRLPPPLRAARAVHAARARTASTPIPTTARSPTRTSSSVGCWRGCAARALYDRAIVAVTVRPRRGPAGPRRAGARLLPLSRGAAGAADPAPAGGRRAGTRVAGVVGPRRPGGDAARPRRALRGRHRRLVAARGDRERPDAGAARVLRDVLPAPPLRLERAARVHRGALPLHPRAAQRALRPRARPGRAAGPRGGQARRGGGDERVARAEVTAAGRRGRRRLGGGARGAGGARLRGRRRDGLHRSGLHVAGPQGQARRLRDVPAGDAAFARTAASRKRSPACERWSPTARGCSTPGRRSGRPTHTRRERRTPCSRSKPSSARTPRTRKRTSPSRASTGWPAGATAPRSTRCSRRRRSRAAASRRWPRSASTAAGRRRPRPTRGRASRRSPTA